MPEAIFEKEFVFGYADGTPKPQLALISFIIRSAAVRGLPKMASQPVISSHASSMEACSITGVT